jgi:hypothetical protein
VYDPITGRFLQMDPIGYKDDLDLYAYVGEDPLDHTDPDGRHCLQHTGSNICDAVKWATKAADKAVKKIPGAVGRAVRREVKATIQSGQHILSGHGTSDDYMRVAAAATIPVGGEGEEAFALRELLTTDTGELIGKVAEGATPEIRTVAADSLGRIVDKLADMGAMPVTKPTYPGQWYEFASGKGGFGIRQSAKNGMTVDFSYPGLLPKGFKLHVGP